MYEAINQHLIVKVKTDPELSNLTLEAEVVSTTEETKKLLHRTIVANRRDFTELKEIENGNQTSSGIYLGNKLVYASIPVDKIVAVVV